MVFDQTLRQISKGHIQYCFLYLDDLLTDLVMVVGNRKTLSLDLKKIKALQVKNQDLFTWYSYCSKSFSSQKEC